MLNKIETELGKKLSKDMLYPWVKSYIKFGAEYVSWQTIMVLYENSEEYIEIESTLNNLGYIDVFTSDYEKIIVIDGITTGNVSKIKITPRILELYDSIE